MATATKTKKRKRMSRKKRRLLWGLSAVLAVILGALVLAGAGLYLFFRPYQDYQQILPNVYYGDFDLGGMTREEAATAITEKEFVDTPVNVEFSDGKSFIVDPRRSYHTQDLSTVLDYATAYGRSASETPLQVYRVVQQARHMVFNIPVTIGFDYDQQQVREQVENIVQQIYIPAEDAVGSGDEVARTVSVTPGAPSRTADTDAIFQAVCSAIETGSTSTVKAEYTSGGADPEQLSDLVDELYRKYASPVVETTTSLDAQNHVVTVTLGQPGYAFNKDSLFNLVQQHLEDGNYSTVTMTLDELMPETLDLSSVSRQYSTEPTPVEYHNGGLTGGDSGYVLEIDTAKELLSDCAWGETREIPMAEVQPKETLEEVEEKLFRDILGRSDTSHTYDYNRTSNLELACSELDGIVLNPGSTFSFNTFVGERTAERGFKTGVVYVDGSSDVETGGGICQVASTVYMAALYADMEITDRANHEFLITYAPGGLDATVYWGVQDFCFRNSSEYPIRINASVSGGQVHVSISGTNTTGEYRKLGSNRITSDVPNTVAYEAFKYIYNSNGTLKETVNLGVSYYSTAKH